MNYFKRLVAVVLFASAFMIQGCDKTKPYEGVTPPYQVHFVGDAVRLVNISSDPAPTVELQVGTTVNGTDARSVTYNISSPSGAVAGTHYTIGTTGTVTIPANQSIGTIDIHPIYSAYATGRRDTLLFTLSQPSIDVAAFQDSVLIILRGIVSSGPCSEDNVDLNTLLGDYETTTEDFDGTAYGPYTTSISSATQTSPTTGRIVVENIFDDGWGPISFDLDWTDPMNRTCIVVDGIIPGTDAGTVFGATYDGIPIIVTEPFGAIGASPKGTYSYCAQTLTLQMELGIDGVGYYPGLYTVNMAR